MEKKLLPSYKPVCMVRGRADNWYFSFYALNSSGVRKKFKRTLNINRIIDLQERQARAQELKNKLNWWLSQGWPIPSITF